jgi:hypothetical protein
LLGCVATRLNGAILSLQSVRRTHQYDDPCAEVEIVLDRLARASRRQPRPLALRGGRHHNIAGPEISGATLLHERL